MRKYGIILSSLIIFISVYTSAMAMPYGIVSGTVTWEGSHVSIPDVTISALNSSGDILESAVTDQAGRFVLELVAGEYYLSAEKNNLVKEYFPDAYLIKEANRITVFTGQIVTIGFALDSGGWISGTFSYEGDAISSGLVTAIKIDQPDEGWYKSLTLYEPFPNAYAISGLYPGTYKIVARGRGKTTEYYPGVLDITEAEAIEVLKDQEISNISFSLSQVGWGTIQGRAVNMVTGQGLSDIPIYAYQWKNFWEDPNLVIVRTACDGNYTLRLPIGNYNLFALFTNPDNGSSTIPLFYNNCYSSLNAETVPVLPNQEVQNINFPIDFSIEHDLTISGVISSFQTGRGLGDVIVSAIDYTTGQVVGSAFSSNDGEYSIDNLSSGQYLLMFSGTYIIPYFYPQANRWRDGEVIQLQGHFGNVRTEAITQDYGNNGLTVAGTVVSDSGPIMGARVYAFLVGQNEPVAFATTDNSGQYTINSGLIPGNYTLICDFFRYNHEIYSEIIHLDLIFNPEVLGIDFHLTDISSRIHAASEPALQIELAGNYPNPFNSSTIIVVFSGFDHEIISRLQVFNVLGQAIGEREIIINPGLNDISWDSRDFVGDASSGVYYYKVEGLGTPRRMLYLK